MKEASDSESNFTIRGGESLAGELAAVYQQMLMQEQGIPYLPTTKQREAIGTPNNKVRREQSPFF